MSCSCFPRLQCAFFTQFCSFPAHDSRMSRNTHKQTNFSSYSKLLSPLFLVDSFYSHFLCTMFVKIDLLMRMHLANPEIYIFTIFINKYWIDSKSELGLFWKWRQMTGVSAEFGRRGLKTTLKPGYAYAPVAKWKLQSTLQKSKWRARNINRKAAPNVSEIAKALSSPG